MSGQHCFAPSDAVISGSCVTPTEFELSEAGKAALLDAAVFEAFMEYGLPQDDAAQRAFDKEVGLLFRAYLIAGRAALPELPELGATGGAK